MSESATDRMFRRPPIVETCGSLGVPSWIVRIRHDGSHGEMQEPRDLYDALVFATRWLKVFHNASISAYAPEVELKGIQFCRMLWGSCYELLP